MKSSSVLRQQSCKALVLPDKIMSGGEDFYFRYIVPNEHEIIKQFAFNDALQFTKFPASAPLKNGDYLLKVGTLIVICPFIFGS